MTAQSQQVLAAALALPPAERAAVLDAIYASFEAGDRREIDAQWSAEAEERLTAFDHGELSAATADEVLARLDRRQAG